MIVGMAIYNEIIGNEGDSTLHSSSTVYLFNLFLSLKSS